MVAAVTGFPARIRRRPHGGPAASRRYKRRRLEKTPTDWGELVHVHDDRDVFQTSPNELPAIDIHSL